MSSGNARRALQNAVQNSTDEEPAMKHFLPCKTKPRQYSPPSGTYAVVSTSEQFLDVVTAPGRGPRLIRVSEEVRYLDLWEPFIIPQGVNASVDCQGAVVNFAKLPADTVPNTDTAINMFGCCVTGIPVGPPFPSERGTYEDVTIKNICESEDGAHSWFQQYLISNGTEGLHYEDQEFLGGIFIWRNVTVTCANKQDLQAEIRELEAPMLRPEVPESSSILDRDGSGDGGAVVASWVVVVLVTSGTLLFMCLCCAAYYLFRGKKGFEVDISTKSSDNLTVHKEQKAWGAYKHANNFPTSPEQPRTARASSGRDNRNEPSELVAIKRVPSVNPNLNPNTNSNSTVEYTVSSTDAGAVDWQSEVNRMPVLKDRPTIGVRKLSDDHPLRKALRTSFSGSSAVQSNVRVPHSDRSVGHEFVPRIDTAPRFPTDRSFDIEHAWSRTAPAATTAGSAAAAAHPPTTAAAPGNGIGRGGGATGVGGTSVNTFTRTTPASTLLPNSGSKGGSITRFTMQTIPLEVALNAPATGSKYREAVKFLGTSGGRHKNTHFVNVMSTNSGSLHLMNSMETTSRGKDGAGVNAPNTVGSGGISPPYMHSGLQNVLSPNVLSTDQSIEVDAGMNGTRKTRSIEQSIPEDSIRKSGMLRTGGATINI